MPEWITRYWVEWLFGLVIAALGAGYRHLAKKVKKRQEEEGAVKDGVVALLHAMLYQDCTHALRDGEVTIADLKNIEIIYNAYHNLGGNGTGTELYSRTRELPLKED